MKKPLSLLFFFLLAGTTISAQQKNTDSLLATAEKARLAYKFREAATLYKEAASGTKDSSVIRMILSETAKCENGSAMLEYGVAPVVNGKATVFFRDFFLYYDTPEDSVWCIVPSNLSGTDPNNLPRNIICLRGGEDEIIFSKKSKSGKWSLYSIKRIEGNKWSYPKQLNDVVNSQGDEIFPYLSKDGSQLFFASNGHYGMGGFDLYVSTRDAATGEWGIPQNLGFPYSSPGNDYLYVNSDDGKFSYLASDREVSAKDSIKIYKLERDINPVKRAFTDYAEIIKVAKLSAPPVSKRAGDTAVTKQISDTYSEQVLKVRQIQASIDDYVKKISSNRNLYESLSNDADKKLLEKKISEDELKLISLQSDLRSATQEVQKSEMDFLQKGLISPRNDDNGNDNQGDNAGQTATFVPVRRHPGKFPEIIITEPVKPFNYLFRKEAISVIAPFDSIPETIIFSVQISLNTRKAEAVNFKGYSPVFENVTSTGKFLYTCGVFYSQESARKALAELKRSGFGEASLVSFYNRKNITIKQADILIKERDKNMGFRVTLDKYYENGIPQEFIDIIRKNTDKDIAKTSANDRNSIFIGTFSTREEAEKLASILTEAGAEGVAVEEFKLQ
jgi:hypothetical protein